VGAAVPQFNPPQSVQSVPSSHDGGEAVSSQTPSLEYVHESVGLSGAVGAAVGAVGAAVGAGVGVVAVAGVAVDYRREGRGCQALQRKRI